MLLISKRVVLQLLHVRLHASRSLSIDPAVAAPNPSVSPPAPSRERRKVDMVETHCVGKVLSDAVEAGQRAPRRRAKGVRGVSQRPLDPPARVRSHACRGGGRGRGGSSHARARVRASARFAGAMASHSHSTPPLIPIGSRRRWPRLGRPAPQLPQSTGCPSCLPCLSRPVRRALRRPSLSDPSSLASGGAGGQAVTLVCQAGMQAGSRAARSQGLQSWRDAQQDKCRRGYMEAMNGPRVDKLITHVPSTPARECSNVERVESVSVCRMFVPVHAVPRRNSVVHVLRKGTNRVSTNGVTAKNMFC